jgi:hypothetical protein
MATHSWWAHKHCGETGMERDKLQATGIVILLIPSRSGGAVPMELRPLKIHINISIT